LLVNRRTAPSDVLSQDAFAKQFRWAGQVQDVQDLLLHRVRPGKLPSHEAPIRALDQYEAVMGKGLEDARYGRLQVIASFRHEAVDRLVPLGQCPADLAFNQSCDQAADHNQEDQAHDPLRLLQEHGPTEEELIGQPEAMLDLVLPLPLLEHAGVIPVGHWATRHQQVDAVHLRLVCDLRVIDRVLQVVRRFWPLGLFHDLYIKVPLGRAVLESLLLDPADDDFWTLVVILVDQALDTLDFGFDRHHLSLTALRLTLSQSTGMD